MKSNRHLDALGLLLALSLVLAACNMPGYGQSPTPLPRRATNTIQPTEAAQPSSTPTPLTPTATATSYVPAPSVTPVAHLAAGAAFDLTSVAMIDLNQGWGIGGLSGASDHVFRTGDGGGTWRDVTPPQDANVGLPQAVSGFFLDSQTGWALYHPSGMLTGNASMPLIVWRTQDGGSSWTPTAPLDVDLSGATEARPDLFFSDSQTGWIMIHLGAAGMHRYPMYLLRSDDEGVTWSVLIDPFNSAYLQSCPKTGWTFTGSTGLASIGQCPYDTAVIDWSSDAGLTWTQVKLPFGSSYGNLAGNAGCGAHSPILLSKTSWIVATDCRTFDTPPQDLHFLYRTSDESSSWSIGEYPGGSLVFLDSQTGWAFGKDIYHTTDGGGTWTQISTVSWDGRFSVVDSQNIWAVAHSGTQYALVKSSNGGSSWAIIDAQIAP
jgi:photosystem II stability/assembly factor-like uncharacterized protein